MAYSFYLYLKQEVLDKDIPFFVDYFNRYPWLREPKEGHPIFVFLKPRIEDGLDRFIPFMEGVSTAYRQDLVTEFTADYWTSPNPETILRLMRENGFGSLTDKIKFEGYSSDQLPNY